jgi:hypothetical protein
MAMVDRDKGNFAKRVGKTTDDGVTGLIRVG